jgi:CBS domain-containing protein
MTLRAITLPPEPLCISPAISLMDALHLMLNQSINHLPVCSDGTWGGLLDINDILGELLPISARGEHGLQNLRFVGDGTSLIAAHLQDLDKKIVREVNLHDLPTLDEDTPLMEAALLLHRHATPLPVLRADGSFKGMLSRRALLAQLINQTGN